MSQNEPKKNYTRTGPCMGIGLVLGGILGLISGNFIIFTGGGMILGLAIGLSLDGGSKGISI